MVRCALAVALLLAAGSAVRAADTLEGSYQSLKEAQSRKDPEQVKKLAAQSLALARKAAAEPAPAAAGEQEAWKKHIAYAKEVEEFTEYALYATAVEQQPAQLVDLISVLEQQSPKSKYLDQGYAAYLYALSKTGAEARIPAVAENAIRNFPENPDLLRVLANAALIGNQNDRALGYARRLVAAAGKRARPDGIDAAEWERQRNAFLGRGYWIAGMASEAKNLHVDADKDLRAALPLIKGDKVMEGQTLFSLGVANYQLGKMTLNKARVLEGARFSEQAAQIEGPHQRQAWLNAQIMKDDAAKMR